VGIFLRNSVNIKGQFIHIYVTAKSRSWPRQSQLYCRGHDCGNASECGTGLLNKSKIAKSHAPIACQQAVGLVLRRKITFFMVLLLLICYSYQLYV